MTLGRLAGSALLVSLLGACAPGLANSGTTRTEVSQQLARGAPIYAQNCATATCQGLQGEGLHSGDGYRVWPLVGPEFTARNPNAQVVFDIARSGPEAELRSLSDQQLYDAIAFELSQNGVSLETPLAAANAASTRSGAAATPPEPSRLFPPPSNAQGADGHDPRSLALPTEAANDHLRLRVTQLAQFDTIGCRAALDGGRWVAVVFNLEALGESPLAVTPERLRLGTAAGQVLAPATARLDYAVASFRPQTIQPAHGTAAHAVFALPAGDAPIQLLYGDVVASLDARSSGTVQDWQ